MIFSQNVRLSPFLLTAIAVFALGISHTYREGEASMLLDEGK